MPALDAPDRAPRWRRSCAAPATSFYRGMRILPPDRRLAMYAIYAFCRWWTTWRTSRRRWRRSAPAWPPGAPDRRRLCRGRERPGHPRAGGRGPALRAAAGGLPGRDRRHADGRRDGDRAPDLATLDLYCDRVAAAVGRLSVRAFGDASAAGGRGRLLAGPGAAAHQHPARPGGGCRARPALSAAASGWTTAGCRTSRRRRSPRPACRRCASACWPRRGAASRLAHAAMAECDRRAMRPARLMGATYGALLDRLEARGWHGGRRRCGCRPGRSCGSPRASCDEARACHRRWHGGAGRRPGADGCRAGRSHCLRGGARPPAGAAGRTTTRSSDCRIDNGNHLWLSGNQAIAGFLRRVGAEADAGRPGRTAMFPFHDLATGRRWTVRPNAGRLPWWVLAPGRRVPGARLREYAGLLRAVARRAGRDGGAGDAAPAR